MNPDIEKLIRLQKADSELKRAEAALADAPHQRSLLDARLREEKARLETAKAGLAESQKERRQHEGALQDLEAKRSRYKGQLMEVKTNKEYTAMLHEIEAVEREIRAREDQILGEMEKAESLGADIKREEAVFKEIEARHRDELMAQAREAEERTVGLETSAAAELEALRRDLADRTDRFAGAEQEIASASAAAHFSSNALPLAPPMRRNSSMSLGRLRA